MIQSKGWNWTEVTENIWIEPSEDIYYYLHRWKEKGFHRFLDMGCGLGRHSILFAENGFEVDAFDLSQEGINTLNAKADDLGLAIRSILADVNHLPYADDSFDCLLAYHVISHTDTQGIKKIVSEIHRVLRTGGEFYVTLCSKSSPSFLTMNYPKIDENTIVKTKEPEAGVPHLYSDLDDVKRIFCDFKIIKVRHIEDIYGDSSSWHYFIHGCK